MLKFVAVLVMCLWISGCNDESAIQPTRLEKLAGGDILKVVEFERHEYVILRVYSGGGICHKANCKFCEMK